MLKRRDHTDWLIHFVHDPLPPSDYPEDHDDSVDTVLHELLGARSAFNVLQTIVRLGGLVPGRSYRNGRTTIYGEDPVVCATEMPLYSFAQYVQTRADPARISAYGVAFLKSEFYAAGGRPAIYGLSTDQVSYVQNTSHVRILDPAIMPITEQYRYVPYCPNGDPWIDWSHEREWRWHPTNPECEYIWCENESGDSDPIPGLNLFSGRAHGSFFRKVDLIVWDRREAEQLQELLTGFYLCRANNYDTPFCRNVLMNSRIIVLNEVVAAVEKDKQEFQTIEGLEEANLVSPIVVHRSLDPELRGKVAAALIKAKAAGAEAARIYAKTRDVHAGYCGFAYASTDDVTSPIVQLLIERGDARGPYDGTALVDLRGDWPSSQSLDFNEAVYSAICSSLSEELQVGFYLYSVPD